MFGNVTVNKPHEMNRLLKIGTRESQLAVWQAVRVQELLKDTGFDSELVFIKSEGDINTVTPLYELGVQGIFTKALDSALLSNHIDIAVHSMKDVPTLLAEGISQAAVLKRASFKDILVYKKDRKVMEEKLNSSQFTIATSSIRRRAQWLHCYPEHSIENLRGNVNTRLCKLNEHDWDGVIFAAAGLERIGLRPQNSIDLDWMLPAPAQGAITLSCRARDSFTLNACAPLNHETTDICTKIERDFLRTLLGGCSTPISALAVIENNTIIFNGNICSTDGRKKFEIKKEIPLQKYSGQGVIIANELLENSEVVNVLYQIRNDKK